MHYNSKHDSSNLCYTSITYHQIFLREQVWPQQHEDTLLQQSMRCQWQVLFQAHMLPDVLEELHFHLYLEFHIQTHNNQPDCKINKTIYTAVI